MARVPRNRYSQVERLRSGRQKAIIVGGVPVPAGEVPLPRTFCEECRLLRAEIGDEIASQPELVRALERPRFRDFLFKQVSLPQRIAESLEDLETGLRSAGLIGVDEILAQSVNRPTKFKVQKRRVSVDGHIGSPASMQGTIAPGPSALSHCAVGRPRVKGSPVSGEALVTSRLSPSVLVRKKGGLPPT